MRRQMIILVIVCIVLLFFYFLISRFESLPFPTWVKSTYHSIVKPKDLYDPAVWDNFKFHEKGFSKRYKFTPKYADFYTFGINFNEGIPKEYEFNGVIKLEIFLNNTPILEKIYSQYDIGWFMKDDLTRYQKICFRSFEIPVNRKEWDNLSLSLTVIEPDKSLERYTDSSKIYVAVSAKP